MIVRLLGPVELLSDGRSIPLGPPQQRSIFALLALDPGRVVATSVLVDRVWGQRLPRDVLAAVYSHVSRLRKALEPTGTRIARRGSGYVLEVEPDQVDLLRARRLCAAARQLATASQAEAAKALELFQDASALWHANPMADVRGDWVERLREYLAQERHALFVDKFDLQLRLGQHEAVMIPLAAEQVTYPLSEPLARLGMLALYRAGWPADALAVYARLRQRMIEALGDEPGPALQEPHGRILRRDPDLDLRPSIRSDSVDRRSVASSPPVTGLPSPPAALLPRATSAFTGREEQLRWLTAQVVRRVPVNRLIAMVAVVPTLVWTSHGVWNVTVNALGMSPGIAVFAFLVFEAMLVNAGYEAEQHRRRYGTPGPHGRYVWVIALTTGTVASLGDPTLVGSVARFVLPLVAAGLWWTTLTAPRPTDTAEMIAAREARARGRSATWAVTPRTVLVAAGIMRPGDDLSMSEADRERRIRRMVVLADRVHSTPADGRSHRRASARLRRLARLATAEDVAEVRARVARAVGVVTEVVPAADPIGSPVSQPGPRQCESGTRTDDRADQAGATAPRRQHNRPRTALHTPAGVRPGHADARQTWLASLQQGQPISGGELGRIAGVDASTGRRWVRAWRAELDTTPTGNDAAVSVNGNGK